VGERDVRQTMEWGVATRRRRGESVNGDVGVVTVLPDGVLVAAIDGLGHGGEAARAAREAGEVVRETPSEDLLLLIERCHDALRDTRGAVIGLAFMSHLTRTVTWLGMGNVEGLVLSADPSTLRPKGYLTLGSGILGHELPSVRTAALNVRPGDVLILATDGIETAFADSLDISGSAQDISERILAVHGKSIDDALVLAVRYLGARA
jgi:phosphoserine phosphatase RsbX